MSRAEGRKRASSYLPWVPRVNAQERGGREAFWRRLSERRHRLFLGAQPKVQLRLRRHWRGRRQTHFSSPLHPTYNSTSTPDAPKGSQPEHAGREKEREKGVGASGRGREEKPFLCGGGPFLSHNVSSIRGGKACKVRGDGKVRSAGALFLSEEQRAEPSIVFTSGERVPSSSPFPLRMCVCSTLDIWLLSLPDDSTQDGVPMPVRRAKNFPPRKMGEVCVLYLCFYTLLNQFSCTVSQGK